MSGSFEAQHPRNHNGTFADKTGGGIPKVSAAQARRNREDGEFLDNLSGLLETGEATLHTGADGKPRLHITGFNGENAEACCETEGRRHWLRLTADGGHSVRLRADENAARKTDSYLGFLHAARENGWQLSDRAEHRAYNGTYAAQAAPGVEVERDRLTGEYLVNGHYFHQDMPLGEAVETERNAVLEEQATQALHKKLEEERPAASVKERTSRFADNLKDYGLEIDGQEPGLVTVGHSGWKETYCLWHKDGDRSKGLEWTGGDDDAAWGSDADAALAASRRWFDGVQGSGNDPRRGRYFGGCSETLAEHKRRAGEAYGNALRRLREAG